MNDQGRSRLAPAVPMPGGGALRRQTLWAAFTVVLLTVCGAVVAFKGMSDRRVVMVALDDTWRTERALLELERCLSDRHRQVSLLAQTYTDDAGEPLETGVLSLATEAVADCGVLARVVVRSFPHPDFAPDWFSDTLSLIEDWDFILRRLGAQHVVAIRRLSEGAEPTAQRLLEDVMPRLRAAQHLRVSRIQGAMDQIANRTDGTLIAALTFPFVATFLVGGLLMRRVLSSLRALALAMDAFGRGQLDHRVVVGGLDEFAEVAARINGMAARLARSQAELVGRAADLQRTVNELESTQAQMVEQQKLAALGELVAGIAHEVNTPLGVAVTAGSLIGDYVSELGNHVSSGTATRGTVRRTALDLLDAVDPLLSNLARASELIRSFKQVAVDRTNVTVRDVVLNQWFHAVMQSLGPLCRRHRVVVTLETPRDVELTCAAGELEQVLTNIVMNACIYAYPESENDPSDTQHPLTISVSIQDDDVLELHIVDAGVGMSKDVADRVFEPFFTTRRGRGGTGLGLHIVHRIVHERFGGQIELDTAPGLGTKWTLRLPMNSEAMRLTSAASDALDTQEISLFMVHDNVDHDGSGDGA